MIKCPAHPDDDISINVISISPAELDSKLHKDRAAAARALGPPCAPQSHPASENLRLTSPVRRDQSRGEGKGGRKEDRSTARVTAREGPALRENGGQALPACTCGPYQGGRGPGPVLLRFFYILMENLNSDKVGQSC